MILCISVVSIGTSFSFPISLIWILSLFFLMSLAKGLSILFIFSKNQLLVSLIFAIVFFVSISFISGLIFMTSFLLLTLDFVCSSFSSCFRCKDSCLFEMFLVCLFLAVLGLCCCMRAFSSCGEWELLLVVVCGLLIAVASLVAEHKLQ